MKPRRQPRHLQEKQSRRSEEGGNLMEKQEKNTKASAKRIGLYAKSLKSYGKKK